MNQQYQCPHCGELFDALRDNLIPYHDYPRPCRSVCPGSKQAPRNPETDKRPLWKDETASGQAYDGSFQLDFLIEGESVRAVGDGTGACEVFDEDGRSVRINIGQTYIRSDDGDIIVEGNA